MTAAATDLLIAFELHDPAKVTAALDRGVDAGAPLRGKLPIEWLLSMYTRSPRLPDCLRALLDRGATLADDALLPVLLDDGDAVAAALRRDPALRAHRTTIESAYTPLVGASLLHVAVEFGHADACRALLAAGVEVDARAALDANGLGAQTPLFHIVNAYHERAASLLLVLLDAGARTDVTLPGIVWGRGFDWETTLFDVTPISYAQCGLLPQMHRDERATYDRIRMLLLAAGRAVPPLGNVPNRYLRPKA